jgi:uncharacterized protein
MNPYSSPFAVVTGASFGVGYELARLFVDHGFDVLVTAEDDAIQAAANELGAVGTSVESLKVDLGSYDGVEKLYSRIMSCGRPVDAIVINAGIDRSGNFAKDTELKAELNLIALNVTSSVHLAKRVISDMVDRKQGRILFTSSSAGTIPPPFEAVYSASRAFLNSFAQALRSELQDFGVNVTALMPAAKDDPADAARNGFEALMACEQIARYVRDRQARPPGSHAKGLPARANT